MSDNWSTPNAHDGRRPGSDEASTQGRNLKREAESFVADSEHSNGGGGNLISTPKHTGGIDLEGAAELWQTPATDSFRSGGGDRKDEMGLDQQARMQWQTPSANEDACGTVDGKMQFMLTHQAKGWEPETSFLPAQQTETLGEPSSQPDPTLPRRLNPQFVEWLQGLPEGWVSPDKISSEALATWSCHCRAHLDYLLS